MARRAIGRGELGAVKIVETASGKWQARGRTRDAADRIKRLSFTAPTREEAEAGLAADAARCAYGGGELSIHTTLAELLEMWLEDRESAVRPQTIRVYSNAAAQLRTTAGALTVEQLTIGRCKRILQDAAPAGSSGHRSKQTRVALRGALDIALEADVISRHPVAAIRRRSRSAAPDTAPTALTVAQVQVLRESIRRREAVTREFSPNSNPYLRDPFPRNRVPNPGSIGERAERMRNGGAEMNDAHATGTHLTCDLADGDVCQKPSGRPCIEDGCTEPAGTQWGPYFCPDHDAARIDLISGSLEASSRPRAVPFAPPVVGGVVLDIALDQHNAIISADPDANLQVMQDIQRVLREVGNER